MDVNNADEENYSKRSQIQVHKRGGEKTIIVPKLYTYGPPHLPHPSTLKTG